jgi:hypothetical protein
MFVTKMSSKIFSFVFVPTILSLIFFSFSFNLQENLSDINSSAYGELNFPAVVGVPKSLLKRYEDSTGIVQTFWSPTTKAEDEEAV